MANLTLVIDDDTLKRARVKALELDTSVNALVREYLEDLVRTDRAAAGRRNAVALALASEAGTEAGERRWTRDELYEEPTKWPRS